MYIFKVSGRINLDCYFYLKHSPGTGWKGLVKVSMPFLHLTYKPEIWNMVLARNTLETYDNSLASHESQASTSGLL